MVDLSKDIISKEEIRKAMQRGADVLANTVKETLGPKGRNVVIENGNGVPTITKDGISVARPIYLKDKFENLGAQLLKQATMKSAEDAGDGTTTATVLAQAILTEGNRAVASGLNPMQLKAGMEAARKYIKEELAKHSREVKNNDEIRNVAKISANGDEEIADCIAKAMDKVGNNGVITVSDNQNSFFTEVEFMEGMSWDKGLISPYLVNSTKNEASYEDCYVLLVDGKIKNFAGPFGKFLELAVGSGRTPLAIIAEDFENDVLSSLILNKLRANMAFLPIKAPGYGIKRKEMIEDLAALTNAVVISEDKGLTFDVLMGQTAEDPLAVIGQAGRVVCKQFNTSVIGGYADEKMLNDRLDYLKTKAEQAMEFDKERYLERITMLEGGTATIKVGGATDIEIKEKKDRLDDALSATKSAVQEGIIPGGGSILYAISSAWEENNKNSNSNESPSFNKGFSIVMNAIQSPIRQILTNAGVENVDKVLAPINFENGYDAREERYGNLLEMGVIDPTKVVRCALDNAVSVAGLMITTEAGIVSAATEEKTCSCHS